MIEKCNSCGRLQETIFGLCSNCSKEIFNKESFDLESHEIYHGFNTGNKVHKINLESNFNRNDSGKENQ